LNDFGKPEPVSARRAFIYAVMAPVIVTTVVAIVVFSSASFEIGFGFAAPIAFGAALLVISLACLLIGIPVTYFLKRAGAENLGAYVAAGLLTGTLIPLILVSLEGGVTTGSILGSIVVGGLNGAICAAVWWQKYRRFYAGQSATAADPSEAIVR
jgi:hypothetical protein